MEEAVERGRGESASVEVDINLVRERWGGGFRRGGERAGEVKRCASDSGIGLKISGPIKDSEVRSESKSGVTRRS